MIREVKLDRLENFVDAVRRDGIDKIYITEPIIKDRNEQGNQIITEITKKTKNEKGEEVEVKSDAKLVYASTILTADNADKSPNFSKRYTINVVLLHEFVEIKDSPEKKMIDDNQAALINSINTALPDRTFISGYSELRL